MSKPKINIVVGIFVSIFQGSLLPIFGILLGKMLFVLQYIPFINPYTKIRSDSDYYCMLMLIVSILSFFTAVSQKFSFGVIGENVTMKIRKQLYSSILSKHMGWFDDKNNSPGVLSSTMASDA
jgi:ATP-binding cassette subfamily B (MDR/TAP) protein 1